MEQKCHTFSGCQGFLSVLCDYDGAMGRSCFHRVLRRRYHGSGSGSKRSASVPLLCDEKRRFDPGFRSRSSGSSGRRDCIKRTSPSGENAVGRYGKGQDLSGRRAEGDVYNKTALRRMAGQQSGGTQRLENPEYACGRVRSGKEKTTSESIWIHIRRIPQFHPEHGIKRRRIHCGNGCGHAACSAFR